MIEYKPASFYTSYFNNHPDFVVREDFVENANSYVGVVEVCDTVHELILVVTIPRQFPHQGLTFLTNSISGYPHLIPVSDISVFPVGSGEHFDELRKNTVYWFCLNSPFAETAEEQLDVEVERLREWVGRNMHKELPAHIADSEVKHALRVANAYEWENPDEIREISAKPKLTFVGDFAYDLKNFQEQMGYLHCIRTPEDRYYAFADEELANCKLPYILIDEISDFSILRDLVVLLKRNGLGEKVFKHLLPWFSRSLSWQAYNHNFKAKSQQDIRESIKKIREKFVQRDFSFPASLLNSQEDQFLCPTDFKSDTFLKLSPDQSKLVDEKVAEFDRLTSDGQVLPQVRSILDDDEDYDDVPLVSRYEDEVLSGKFHYFAVGYPEDGNLSWLLLGGNVKSPRFDLIKLDLGFADLYISKLVSFALTIGIPEVVGKGNFWGRGSLSDKFQGMRIGLIGLGALGSMVAESLARSGVVVAGLWDNDVVEPGNICRSVYTLRDIGKNKAYSIARKLRSLNPNIVAINSIGSKFSFSSGTVAYDTKGFYTNVNYRNQEDFREMLQDFEVVIDCTGSNELLHFLSYVAPQIVLISLCITNHANDLLCITNRVGNPFELRKSYLSRIEQDTKNYYEEGRGCYAPTFMARNCDISSLVNLAIRELDVYLADDKIPDSMIFSHNRRGVLVDRLIGYKAEGYDIWLTVPSEALMDAEEMPDVSSGEIGYILGSYSRDGGMVMVTHIIEAAGAEQILSDAFYSSQSIIDYIGDYTYSGVDTNTYREESLLSLKDKAEDVSINTNNPLLALRNPDGSVSFFLYLNESLVPFFKCD